MDSNAPRRWWKVAATFPLNAVAIETLQRELGVTFLGAHRLHEVTIGHRLLREMGEDAAQLIVRRDVGEDVFTIELISSLPDDSKEAWAEEQAKVIDVLARLSAKVIDHEDSLPTGFTPLKVLVIGLGHVGLITAGILAFFGYEVVGLDEDEVKVSMLKAGEMPFYEPGLQALLDEVIREGRLDFTHEVSDAFRGAECAFICVGTPSREAGDKNLLAVENAAWAIARNITAEIVVIQKSAVPLRTADRLAMIFAKGTSQVVRLVVNPDFLREGSAIEDCLRPERLLVGSDDPVALAFMRRLYEPVLRGSTQYFEVDILTAELAKYACNTFLALKISFANALARICEASGADVVSVADILGSDHRIGREFLNPGLGYGGYSLSRDVPDFYALAGRLGYEFGLLNEVIKINQQAIDSTFRKITDALWNVESKRILLLGLAFKAGTDDVRDSPALKLAAILSDAGAIVFGHDPQANRATAREFPDLHIVDNPYAGAEGAHCIVICTAWPEYRDLDFERLKGIVTFPIVIDGPNLLDSNLVVEAGFSYVPTGRPPQNL